jgi:hypothetical protein
MKLNEDKNKLEQRMLKKKELNEDQYWKIREKKQKLEEKAKSVA